MSMDRERESYALPEPQTVACEFMAYLLAARQSRILIRACPAEADTYKSRCRYWLAMAHKAQGPPLP